MTSRDYAEVRDEIFASNPAVRELWESTKPKREVALCLAIWRHVAGLTQQDVADRTGWNKEFVQHLEGAIGDMPDAEIILRFAVACRPVT